MRALPLAILVTTSLVAGCPTDKKAELEREAIARVERGAELQMAGKYAAAITVLRLAIESNALSNDQLAEAWTIVGLAYNEQDQFDQAIDAHKRSLGVKPDFHKAWVNLGVAQRLKGNLDAAEASYLRALELAPDYAEANASLGAIYILRNDPAKAIEFLERAMRLDNGLAVAHANIAIAYAMTARYDEADAALKRAVERGYKNGAKARSRIDELRATSVHREGSPVR
jgi:tetratricopeptide (TPR) repeat protein